MKTDLTQCPYRKATKTQATLTKHRKPQKQQHEPDQRPGMNSSDPKWSTISVPLVILFVLLLNNMNVSYQLTYGTVGNLTSSLIVLA